ncbi:MAG: nicotinate-nucleotide--dimethylbenzimidazole phosphoribosyltransferase [Candidatus Omnitrophota bacterium]
MDEIKRVISKIENIDSSLAGKAQERLNNLTKPQGSLGKLEDLAKQIVGVTGKLTPELKNKVIFTIAADHGVADEGVSAFPKEVTAQMVYNFLRGGAGINVLANHIGARVIIVDAGVACDLENKEGRLKLKKVNYGTKNMAKSPAMSREEATRSIEVGIEAFEEELSKGMDIIGTGEMGIANTTASSAITSIITGISVEEVTGKGTGIADKALANKIEVIKRALSINKPNSEDAIDVLSKIGGFEIGGLAGIMLAAASYKVPVVIDGFISGAAALIAYKLEPKTKDYMIAAHCSLEKGHKAILDYLGLKALLDFNLRLGEGTGAALAIGIVEAGVKILNEMATFGEAGVSEKK